MGPHSERILCRSAAQVESRWTAGGQQGQAGTAHTHTGGLVAGGGACRPLVLARPGGPACLLRPFHQRDGPTHSPHELSRSAYSSLLLQTHDQPEWQMPQKAIWMRMSQGLRLRRSNRRADSLPAGQAQRRRRQGGGWLEGERVREWGSSGQQAVSRGIQVSRRQRRVPLQPPFNHLMHPRPPTCLVAGSKAQAAAAAVGMRVGAPAVQAPGQLVKRQLSVSRRRCATLLGAILLHNLLQRILGRRLRGSHKVGGSIGLLL